MELDHTDICIRQIYGESYATLSPICKALITCMAHGDYSLSKTIFEHIEASNRAQLLPLHRDIISILSSSSSTSLPKVETTWLADVLAAWAANNGEKAAEILRANDKQIDKFSVSWLLAVKNNFASNRK